MKAILKDGRVLDVVLGKGFGVLCTDGVTEYIYTLGVEIDKIVPDKIWNGYLLSKDIDWQQVKIQSAIAAMQAQLANPELLECVTSYDLIDGNASEKVAKMSVKYARALVEELRKM
jgi:hypothetical protein